MVIVTGGAGFIGSTLVKYLNKKGLTDIIIIDDLTDGRKFANLKDLEFVEYRDVDDALIFNCTIEKVYHIGGISSTTETNGKKLMKYNYESTMRWYDFCVTRNIPLIYTSSASVYGNSESFNEDDACDPLNAYAYSKYMSEKYILNNGCINTWIFRPFNVYGKREDFKEDQSSPITKFKQQHTEQGYVNVFTGSDRIKRDFICVDDVVKILVDFTEEKPGIYNLGTGETESFFNVAKYISDDVREIDFPSHLKGRYQYFSKANITRLRTLIHRYNFTDVKDYIFSNNT